jgi:hypothetical protein
VIPSKIPIDITFRISSRLPVSRKNFIRSSLRAAGG